ncbi:hypothetical protein UlMin_015950 [Ulmus minor]
MMKLKAPCLVDLCVKTGIDNLRYPGDVGEMDLYLLDQILPHCGIDHLEYVEKGSQGGDLSPVTDKMWKKFYRKEFGVESKTQGRTEKADEACEKITKLYKKEDARKQSLQVRICTKVPPSTKISFWGGSGLGYNVSSESKKMKKAKVEYLKSSPPILKTRKDLASTSKQTNDLASLDPLLRYFRSTEASAKDAVSNVLCVVPHMITDLELKSPKNKLCRALMSQRNRMRSPRLERKQMFQLPNIIW